MDTDTLFVDAASNNVGIGTSSPQSNLHVTGTIKVATGNAKGILGLGEGGGTTVNVGLWRGAANNPSSDGNFLNLGGYDGIVFATGAAAIGSQTERLRIDASGNVYVPNDISVGTTDVAPAANNVAGHSLRDNGRAEFSSDGGVTVYVNRLQDGTLMSFRSAGNGEGSISVSGTTVSYNGGHLSRWSQTADNTRIDLLKGTVMTNLDQMAVWGDEDNEQLNCMAVSSVEGDPNVAGVFVNWDDDDDEDYVNDMNIAMTGDMIIRIAQGTIVQRGDLLMSAGDGTAKPQGDDIIRSKTIAKVTSTHVTCTYEDGSYCVPCVLMAC